MPRITEMYAFVAEESGPGDEGIVAMKVANSWMPLVGADMKRAASLRRMAVSIARVSGKKIRLVRFTNREDLEEIE